MTDSEHVFFLDVGQGSANVIHLGQKRFVIVDGGPAHQAQHSIRHPVRETIFRMAKDNTGIIEVFAITHLHNDHWRAIASQFMSMAAERNANRPQAGWFSDLKKIVIADPRPLEVFIMDQHADLVEIQNLIFSMLEEFPDLKIETMTVPEGSISRRVDLENTASELHLLHPTHAEAESAIAKKDLNRGSGVFLFKSGLSEEQFVFSGDAPLQAWQRIHERMASEGESKRIRIRVLAVSHHGGNSWRELQGKRHSGDYENRVSELLKKVFVEFLEVDYGFISVGSNNPYQHPYELVITALQKAGTQVLCSQITHQCLQGSNPIRSDVSDNLIHGDKQLDDEHRVLIDLPVLPGLSRLPKIPRECGGLKDFGCASSIVAVIERGAESKILRVDDHKKFVDRIHELKAAPLCRSRS